MCFRSHGQDQKPDLPSPKLEHFLQGPVCPKLKIPGLHPPTLNSVNLGTVLRICFVVVVVLRICILKVSWVTEDQLGLRTIYKEPLLSPQIQTKWP